MPVAFKSHFPKDIKLDGEFFTKRQDFNTVVSIVRSFEADKSDETEIKNNVDNKQNTGTKQPSSSRWDSVRFCAFDIPSIGDEPFEKRYETLNALATTIPSNVFQVVQHSICKGKLDLDQFLANVVQQEGEGL